jgi:DNA (cytosine-5)-methyltransferase 1
MIAPTGIELFAGCGGTSTGFLDAGLFVAAGFDSDARSIEAYEYNHAFRGSRGYVRDLNGASGASLLTTAGLKSVDFLLGGPPCQPFSIAGKRGGSSDARASLIEDYERLIEELEPQAIFFENVPNLATIEDGKVLNRFLQALRRMKYVYDWGVISAADYGVPQNRRRLLLVAARGIRQVRLPEATHGSPLLGLPPHVACKAVIDDLPDASDFGEFGIHNHEKTIHSEGMLERFRNLDVGRREKGSFHDRLHPERPSYTLRAGTGNFSPLRPVHYRHDRVITVRESARLQTFSDDFIWPDSIPRLQQYRQVGNAVPPLLAKRVAQSMASQLGWKAREGGFQGDPASRVDPITLSDSERQQRRFSRIRGASLGRQPA